jgi:ubiquinone/menaquinone biosynthesis C-methylase UbiE
MPDSTFGPLRIWDGPPPAVARSPGPAVLAGPESSTLEAFAGELVAQEILRQPPRRHEPIEPLSLEWFLEIESLRHHRQGHWIPPLLEFTRHAGERLLGLGGGLGSDWVQYARHGAEVTCACASAEQLALVRRNFELRGLHGTFLHAGPTALPLDSASIDVVCLTGLLHELPDPAQAIDEVYRVLKPGGKVLAVVPARYNIDFWAGWWLRAHRRDAGPATGLLSPTARRFCARQLRQLFARFHEPRVSKRHLRRAEVPHLWRWLPVGMLERLVGRLLVFRAFKPVSAAICDQAAA